MTFQEIINYLDLIDEECMVKTGSTIGLATCGTGHSLSVLFEQVLWDQEENPADTYAEFRKHLLAELRDITERLNIAIKKLEADDEESKGQPHVGEPRADAAG